MLEPISTIICQCHQELISVKGESIKRSLKFSQFKYFHSLHSVYPNSSGNHSRASSLTEDNESYMSMHPAGSYHASSVHDDYTNMQAPNGDMSSATSSCSITSGTPSTDIRFSEYHLEKVHAYFTPSEDDDRLTRPPRTWSVGSKLEHSKRKHHTDRVLTNEMNNSRLRAYSVGSRIMKNSNVRTEEPNGSHSGSSTPSHNSPVAMNHHEINNNTRTVNSNSKSKKSSSAPILAQSFVGRTSHGSVDHMDDLMEIDYSNRSGAESGAGSNLMEIDYSNRSNSSSQGFSHKSSPVNIPHKSSDDYTNKSNTPSAYVDMRPGSSGRRPTLEQSEGDYMNMSKSSYPGRGSSSSTPLSSSPMKIRTNPLMPPPQQAGNYVDMSPRSYDTHVRARGRVASKSLTKDFPKQSSVPDGYLEMSFKKPSNSSASISANSRSNENPSSSSDEYINMDFSNNNEIMISSGSSSSSKPITIQKRHINDKIVKSGSPPAFLPLNNQMTASISPTRSTNRTRCDSRDSGIVTPSSGSQATIFPFSPGSPMKQFDPHDDLQRRLNDDDVIEEEPRTPVPMGTSNVETLSSDYAVMNLGEPVSKKPNLAATPVQTKSPSSSHFLLETDSENHDYINCTPINMAAKQQPQQQQPQSRLVTPKPINLATSMPESGDYALMNPVKASAALSPDPSTSSSCIDTPPKTSSKKSLLLSMSSHEKLNNSNTCFKPIVEDSHPHQFQRHSSERGYPSTPNESSHDVRPNSVNSEKIKSVTSMSGFLSNRPSSANSERLRSTSSSTSTLCESQTSSSQILRNLDASSSVPSPMSLTSRPESVSSDIHMASRPPSVTSEREIHYASLDLPPCSSSNPHNQPHQPPQKMDVDQKMECSTSPNNSNQNSSSSSSSSVSSQQSQSVFTYAQIDFNKSEQLKAQQQQNHQSSSGKK